MKISSPKAINWTLKQYGYTIRTVWADDGDMTGRYYFDEMRTEKLF
jgi:hypothetical protein